MPVTIRDEGKIYLPENIYRLLAKSNPVYQDVEFAQLNLSPCAIDVCYDNTTSGLAATNVQDAIDELDASIDSIEGDITTIEGDISTIEGDISTIEGFITGTYKNILYFGSDGNIAEEPAFTYDPTINQMNILGSALIGLSTTQVFIGTTSGLATISPQDTADTSLLNGLFTTLKVGQVQSWVTNHPDATAIFNSVTKNSNIDGFRTIFGRSDNADITNVTSLFEHSMVRMGQAVANNRAPYDIRFHSLLNDPASASTFPETTQARFYIEGGDSAPWLTAVAGTPDPGLEVLALGRFESLAPQAYTNLAFRGSKSSYTHTYTTNTILLNRPQTTGATEDLYAVSHINLDTTAGTLGLTLPATTVSGNPTYREFVITNTGINKAIIVPTGGSGNTISGLTSFRLDPQCSVYLIASGTDYKILSEFNPFRELWISSDEFVLPSGSTAALGVATTVTNGVAIKGYSFAAGSDTSEIQFTVAMPRNWNKDLITLRLFWTSDTATTGDCKFRVAINPHTVFDPLDSAWLDTTGFADSISDARELQISSQYNLDAGITPTTSVDHYTLRFRINREGTDVSDTMAGAAILIGAKLHYKTNGSLVGPTI